MTALIAIDADHRPKVRLLNDALRTTGRGGRILITPGISGLPPCEMRAILIAVADFTAFDADNDPYGEHDCAVVSVGPHRVIWKIDAYDLVYEGHSPDPADPTVTRRVLTIMLAEEY